MTFIAQVAIIFGVVALGSAIEVALLLLLERKFLQDAQATRFFLVGVVGFGIAGCMYLIFPPISVELSGTEDWVFAVAAAPLGLIFIVWLVRQRNRLFR